MTGSIPVSASSMGSFPPRMCDPCLQVMTIPCMQGMTLRWEEGGLEEHAKPCCMKDDGVRGAGGKGFQVESVKIVGCGVPPVWGDGTWRGFTIPVLETGSIIQVNILLSARYANSNYLSLQDGVWDAGRDGRFAGHYGMHDARCGKYCGLRSDTERRP